jgi:hypothetical protein
MVLEYNDSLQIILKIGTSISIFFGIIDIVLYAVFPQNRSFSFTNIIILAGINLLYSISTLLPADITLNQPENTTWCQIQSFLVNFSHCAQYLQVSIISYCIFIKLITRNHLEKNAKIYRSIFFLLLLSFSLVFSIYILLTKAHGTAHAFCWINLYSLYQKNHIKKLILNYYTTIWFLLFVNIFFIVKVKVMMKKNKIRNEMYEHLLKYPIILIILSLPGTFNMIYHIIYNQKDIEAMVFIQVISESCFGLVINIYFITSPWIKENIKNAFKFQNNESLDQISPIRDSKFSVDDEK